jgi:hypothetical protein
MSPTSYQAAPPRDRTEKLARHTDLSRSRTLRRIDRRVRVRKAIQQFLASAHHPKFFARDPLLQRRIRFHAPLVAPQGVDKTGQRIDLATQLPLARALPQKIRRPVLTTLDRKHDCTNYEGGLHKSAQPRVCPTSRSSSHVLGPTSVTPQSFTFRRSRRPDILPPRRAALRCAAADCTWRRDRSGSPIRS